MPVNMNKKRKVPGQAEAEPVHLPPEQLFSARFQEELNKRRLGPINELNLVNLVKNLSIQEQQRAFDALFDDRFQKKLDACMASPAFLSSSLALLTVPG